MGITYDPIIDKVNVDTTKTILFIESVAKLKAISADLTADLFKNVRLLSKQFKPGYQNMGYRRRGRESGDQFRIWQQ